MSFEEFYDWARFSRECGTVFPVRADGFYQSDFTEDSESRVHLDVPFTAGLYGAPIYDDEGSLVGFVESQLPIGKNLSLAVGIPITSLKTIRP